MGRDPRGLGEAVCDHLCAALALPKQRLVARDRPLKRPPEDSRPERCYPPVYVGLRTRRSRNRPREANSPLRHRTGRGRATEGNCMVRFVVHSVALACVSACGVSPDFRPIFADSVFSALLRHVPDVEFKGNGGGRAGRRLKHGVGSIRRSRLVHRSRRGRLSPVIRPR